MNIRSIVAGVLLITIISVGHASAKTVTVSIRDFSFGPANLTIAPGDSVIWTNQDSAPHTVTSTDGGPLNSPNLNNAESYSFTFSAEGTFAYRCNIHPSMTGSITVATPAPAAISSPTIADTNTLPAPEPSELFLRNAASENTPISSEQLRGELRNASTLASSGPEGTWLAIIGGALLCTFVFGRKKNRAQ